MTAVFRGLQGKGARRGRRASHSNFPTSRPPSSPTNRPFFKQQSSTILWPLEGRCFDPQGAPGAECGAHSVPSAPVTDWKNPTGPQYTSPFLCFPYREILPDLDQRFKGKPLTNGTFTCDIKGVYFFTYHISAKNRVSRRLSFKPEREKAARTETNCTKFVWRLL